MQASLLSTPSASSVMVTLLKTPVPGVPPPVVLHEPMDVQLAVVGLLKLSETVTR